MPMLLFETLCALIIVVSLYVMGRSRGSYRQLLRDYSALALGAWLGEESCIQAYRYYAYSSTWHLRVDHVPLLVPLIWPLVILSARGLVDVLWPSPRSLRHVVVAAVVVFDASLVEVVAVRAGLWSWAEGGHLGVPIMGIIGWGTFALGASIALSTRSGWRWIGLSVGAAVGAHALILLLWWTLLRWILRGDLGLMSFVGLAAMSAAGLTAVLLARRKSRGLSFAIAGPRMIAAGLFVALLLVTAPTDIPLWTHTIVVSIPYLAASQFKGRYSPAGQAAAMQPFPPDTQ